VTPLKRLIIEKTEGTPLFIEETIQMLFEEGALVRNGQVKIARSLSGLSIPSTVQAILASRIDRLSAAEKQLLQTLAVLGIEFPLKLAAQVAGKQEEELLAMLASLQQREFIYEQLGDGDLAYTFKHALTHDVAYNSVLMERRRQLHERTGVALETLYASSIDDHLVELAHHYSRTNNPDKAVEYHGRAAQQALSRSAFNEALSLGRAGLALVPELAVSAERSRREFSLLSTLVRAASAIEGYGSQQTAIGSRRMLEIARELGDDGRLFYGAVRNVDGAQHRCASPGSNGTGRSNGPGSRAQKQPACPCRCTQRARLDTVLYRPQRRCFGGSKSGTRDLWRWRRANKC
jgi:predicted ATPase